jgi:hypothetical protein
MRSEQGEADEFARFSGRQAEGRREPTKERGLLGPDPRLYRRATAKKLEPSGVHAMHCLGVPAEHFLVDEPLRAVESPSTNICGEMPFEVTLDRSNRVRHYATSCSSSDSGGSVRS